MGERTAITPTRAQDYPEWYQQVVKAGDLAETSPVRGCMVIKPWGYALWENIQRQLDRKFKETGHVNAYFPLLIPLSFLEKEAEHVEGFAKECAVVTHHRLEASSDGKLVPGGELEEPLIIRPTSETIIGHSFSKWVQSYRDLPLLINQWCNIMRWEMRTRLFLRTAEILWQEGHTAHATRAEAEEETLKMIRVYEEFGRDWLAMPLIVGTKTPDERFPGAVETYTIEAMMQDGKALQAGTAHFLGQNFAKAQDITFLDQEGQTQHVWTTSWGVTTRLIGSLVMVHSDDDGLILPPKLAPAHVVVLPIYKKPEEREAVLAACNDLKAKLVAQDYHGAPVRVEIDDRDIRGGEKNWQHIKRGVPLRVEIGPRDLAKGQGMVTRRDQGVKDKNPLSFDEIVGATTGTLDEIQANLYAKALEFRESRTRNIDTEEEFRAFFDSPEPGFAMCHWHEAAIDHPLLTEFKVTPRAVPIDGPEEVGKCLFTGNTSRRRVVFAKSY